MEDISLHILDIAENSIEAKAKAIRIRLVEDAQKDKLTLVISDNGKGMDAETLRKAINPFFTTKQTRRVGLGLSLLQEAAKAANGHFAIRSKFGEGTRITVSFQLSHIDRKPLGDIPQTLVTLIAGHPDIDLLYTHRVDRSRYSLSTKDINARLDGVAINSPEVLKFIRNHIKEGLSRLRRKNERRKIE